ncbi:MULTISPECIES: RagB/SusD family nutrient uptake outer membrane protein [Niastella]|uniref:RagB/SusD family nutrient uptake outer membrane protein n=1 Tax=Niastella soli TaxID=2821487 RepID=A0ABS3Z0U9_9BACT|nr:RagB/SusD family nutrient uptake outer membrane protein [Niastella soli]MBO9203783.1 RagB/SusD family nutrient uptake outer membrane protein [Niastella soli]
MKKIVGYSLIALVGLLSACEKQLDQNPISGQASSDFYTSKIDFTQGVNAVYNGLKTYPDRLLNLSETRSDNLYAVSDGGVRDWEGINSFQKTIAGNVYVNEAWTGNFNAIFRANSVLEQLAARSAVIGDSALAVRFEAETRFLRAFYYFDLVRLFGKVPIIDKVVTPAESVTIGRSSVSDVYNFIISDLKFATDNLPETYAAADKGRATKYAAKGMLALVYMTRSSPTYNINGPGLALNEWSQALTLLNDIIASKKYVFGPSYADIFNYDKENNQEVIFDVQYNTGSNPVVGATFPWLLVPDNYFQAIGKTTQGGLTIRPVSNDLLNAYDPADTRKSFSVHGGFKATNGAVETRNFFKKYVDTTKVPLNRVDWPINFIVLRYTDVLMMKAECILHGAAGTQADVDAIVNQVRGRALLTPVSNVTLANLFEERRKEFAAEGSRWHDLVRSGNIESIMTTWITKEDVGKTMQPFQKNYILYPIPQSELDVKPGLYDQNPGY